MTFTRPLLLSCTILLPYFVYLGWPRGRYGRRRAWAALVLRTLIVALVILSLAGTQAVHGGDELAVVFLLDVSDSVPDLERERALAFVEDALQAMRPDDRAALVLFGADALVERPMVGGQELGAIASVPRTHQTDLEDAIRLGMALFPAGAARRMVILSDGRPTVGEAEQALRLARTQGVRVDVLPLEATLPGEAWLADLVAPNRLHQGEEFALSVTVRATRQTEADLVVVAGEDVVAQERVRLNPGSNTFAVPLMAGEPGFAPLRAYLAPANDTYSQNNALSTFSLVEGPPRVLVVAADPGESEPLVAALQAAGLDVGETLPGALPSEPAGLAEYAAVVLVDTPAKLLSPRAMDALQSFVRDLGGGLVTVGGPHAYGVGGWYDTPLEDTLPVEMTIDDPQRFPPMSIVVIIDKSGSMSAEEGGVQKIRLAGEAAARVAELITDLDDITVIAFDDRPADVIGPLPGTQRDEVISRVTRLQAGGGGIYVRESLEEALRYLADSDKNVRHIILLADGSDAEHQQGVARLVQDEMAGGDITLSTVAIGTGSDLRFLEGIAALGNGRTYFTDRAATLPVIFAQETQLAMRSYIVEEPFYPQQASSSPILTAIETVPQLAGYVATTPKPAGRIILTTHQQDPLLAAWQYGLGRSVAWTSDATGRWAQRWVAWEAFSRFWAQAVRWTIVERSDVPVEVAVTRQGARAYVTMDAVDSEGAFVNGLDARVSVVGPGGSHEMLDLAQTAPGRYEGAFEPEEEGAYLMRVTGALDGEEAVALTTGWAMGYSPEYAALEGDPTYLAGLADLGGGGVLETPVEAVAHNVRGVGVRQDLWPAFLGLAACLLPFDVGVRRLALGKRDLRRALNWVVAHLPRQRSRRQPRSVVGGSSPVGRLFEAKARGQARAHGQLADRPAGEDQVARKGPDERLPRSVSPAAAPPVATPETQKGTLANRLLRRRRERREED